MVQQASLENLRRAFDRAVYGAERRAWIVGLLGMRNQDGTTTIEVPDRTGWVYVAIGPEGSQIVSIARNDALVPHRAQLPVRMKRDIDQALIIQGTYNVGSFADEGTGGDLHTTFGVIWHHHRIGGGLEYEHQALLFDQGRGFSYDAALQVYINSFRYQRKETGTWDTWMGGPIDLSSYKPVTTGHWAWVIVGIDPATNTAVAAVGASQAYAVALTIDLIDAIDFNVYIPCIAVRLRNDAVTIANSTDYLQDAHKWFGESYHLLDDLVDVTDTSPAENDTMWYNGSNWVTGIGHRLNMATSTVLTISGGTLNIDAAKTSGLIEVRGESSIDDVLDTITGGNYGDIIVLWTPFPGIYGRISVESGGNINVPTSTGIFLDGQYEILALIYNQSGWQVFSPDKRLDTATVTMRLALDVYINYKARNEESHIHGNFVPIVTGQPLDSVPTDISITNGLSKMVIVVNAGSDFDGEITVTGTSVDRDTGAETGSDTDVITVDALTTDDSTTDANGNEVYDFTGAYITSKWFKGAVILSTTDLTLTDVDVYQVSFEQFGDTEVTVQTLDVTAEVDNDAAWCDIYLYFLQVTGDKCDIASIADVHVTAVESTVGRYYRLRQANLATICDGATNGIWIGANFGRLAQRDWEDMGIKVWYDEKLAVNLI